MTKMTDSELTDWLQASKLDAVKYNGEFMAINEDLLAEYMALPYGDEQEGMSQVVSTDIQDVIEADMPSLARIFLGSNDILEFKPNTDNPEEQKEADEKTKYINWLVRNRPDSFKTMHDWMKDAEIQKFGAVKFYVEECKKTEDKEYRGLDDDELAALKQTLEERRGVEKVDILETEKEDGLHNIKFRVTMKQQKVVIQGVPTEDFLITRNAKSKDSAPLVGDLTKVTRGSLIAEGYSKEDVKKLPVLGGDTNDRMKEIRFESQGGYLEVDAPTDLTPQQLAEEVHIANLYVLIDYDGDGIPERRNIICSADCTVILSNEPYGIVPYALLSAVLMPHSAIGRSRAEITAPTQYVKTHLLRQVMDNIYQVNQPGTAVNDSNNGGVDLDDLLVHGPSRIVRVQGNPAESIMPLVTPYIGDKALQVIQYIDYARAQSTGSLMASQGLDADKLHKETATRFEGVSDASEAKVELVARVYAETGFRELFEGLVWTVSHYQDEATEIMVLGKPLTIKPSSWKYEHNCTSLVGLGAGDNEQVLQNMTGVLQVQQGLLATGSPLVDQKKIYNTVATITKAMGKANVSAFFNDPERPDQVLMAENEQLKAMLQAMQQTMQNPEIQKAQIQAQARIEVENNRTQAKTQSDLIAKQAQAEVNAAKEAGSAELEMNKFLLQLGMHQEQNNQKQAQQQMQFQQQLAQQAQQFQEQLAADLFKQVQAQQAKLTELELKYTQGSQTADEDIPGSLV